jgi:hypothetical protein
MSLRGAAGRVSRSPAVQLRENGMYRDRGDEAISKLIRRLLLED